MPAVQTKRGKGAQTFDSVFMYKHNDEMVFADLDFSAQHCWNLLDLFRTNSDSIRVLDLSYNQGMQCKLEDIVERMDVGSGTSTSSASTATPFAGIAHLNLGRCFFVPCR